MARYRIFTRTWWADDPSWPGGLRPQPGRKRTIGHADDEREAQAKCREHNAKHDPGRYSLKAEYETVST